MLHVLLEMVRPRPGPCRTCGPTEYPALNFNFCKTVCNWLARTGKGPVPERGGTRGGRGAAASSEPVDRATTPGFQRTPPSGLSQDGNAPQPPRPSPLSRNRRWFPWSSHPPPCPEPSNRLGPGGASTGRSNQPGLAWEQRPKALINHGPNHPAGRGLVRGGCRFCIE